MRRADMRVVRKCMWQEVWRMLSGEWTDSYVRRPWLSLILNEVATHERGRTSVMECNVYHRLLHSPPVPVQSMSFIHVAKSNPSRPLLDRISMSMPIRSLLSRTGIAGANVLLAPMSFEETGVCGPVAELTVVLGAEEISSASSNVREIALAAFRQTL